ncbi:MAG TPA: ATP-grasp domain-containing protein [Longimicrobium sp.]|jgi:biotin carboxylase|uniref:ATP-grasp domain-containing protein n=1 Tax=Longimicrobium sp. TaxID=2029185 RepID=UPI002EDB0758
MSPRELMFIESNTSGTGRLFVLAARRLGFAPVLVTARPERYAFLADAGAPEVVVVPRVDEDSLYPLVRDRDRRGAGVAGITSSSEYFIATAAALAARMGLPGPDAVAVRAARDKGWQRRVLADGGVAVPAFHAVQSARDAVRAARETGFPVVLKPVAGSGSVGVRACASADEVEAHAAALFAASPGERVLVESLVQGPEFSVEVFNGRVVGITRKHLGHPPAFVEAGHDYPAAVPDDVARALTAAVIRGTELLRLGWGPLHWELRMSEGGAVPMEVNPRLAGGFIPELVRHAQGIDLICETLRLVAGESPRPAPRHHRHASIRFLFVPGDGRLAGVDGVAQARAHPGVAEVALYRAPGDELRVHGDFRDRMGHVIACAGTPAHACLAAERGRAALRVRVEDPAGVALEVG